MIGRISGTIIERSVSRVLVDVGGLGYEVDIPLTTYYRLAAEESVTLHTHMVVREDAHQLFGFHTIEDRDLFRALIKVNSVGPRLALNILSGMESEALARCIQEGDVKALTALPGIGKRTAERLVLDLRDKLEAFAGDAQAPVVPATDNMADAEAALIGLGFKPQEAARALAGIDGGGLDVEALIKQALKALT